MSFFFLPGCKKTKSYLIQNNGFAQGTTYNIKYFSENNHNYQSQIDSILNQIDNSLSTYIEHSTISKINNNILDSINDKLFIKMFILADSMYKTTEGFFDPTIAPLINLYEFNNSKEINIDKKQIEETLNFIGFNKIELKNHILYKKNPNIKLDFNAIAQGYSVDIIGDFLKGKGILNFLIEIGGEVKALGLNINNKKWLVGIDKPNKIIEEKRVFTALELYNRSLATSGSYRNFKHDIKNDIIYSHTINPFNGLPSSNNLMSVSVISNNCGTADAIATALMVMGKEKSINFLKKNRDYEAMLIFKNKENKLETYQTKGFLKMIVH